MAHTITELFLVFWLLVFGLVAFTFEPALVFCHSDPPRLDGLDTCALLYPTNVIVRLWKFYADSFDPFFSKTHGFMLIMVSIDWLLFGPTYFVLAYGLWTRQAHLSWYRNVCAIWCGALVYSTILYFGYEILFEWDRSSMFWVFVINIPWTIVPPLVLWHAVTRSGKQSRKVE